MGTSAYPSSRVQGVGSWAGIVEGIGDFFASDLGGALLTVGTTIGTAALSDSLFGSSGNSQPQQTQQQNAAPTSPSSPVQPAQITQPPPQQVIVQPPVSEHDYTIPIVLGIGMLGLMFVMSNKK